MAKLTDADGTGLVRLINELMEATHRSLITDLDIHYRTAFVNESGTHHGWSVRMGIGVVTNQKTTALPSLVDALQTMATQLADARRRLEIPTKRKR